MTVRTRRAVVYDPHLSTLGGAERYAWEIAALLGHLDHETVLAGPALPSASDVSRYGFDPSVRLEAMGPGGFLRATRGADVSVWVDNAVPRPSLARRRLGVLSFPFQDLHGSLGGLLRRALLSRVDEVVVYSEFARDWTRRRWDVEAEVVPPAVVMRGYEPSRKRPLILAVGRFFPSAHSKRQDVLVDGFRALRAHPEAQHLRLALAGGLERDRPDHVAWYDSLLRRAADLPVDFYPSVDNAELDRLFAEASVFWHAAGTGRAPDQPERAEHFGITTVEAMSAGAVPVVHADGGQLEIVTPEVGGLWRTVDELVAQTLQAMRGDQRDAAVARSRTWDQDAFRTRFAALID